MADPLLIQDPAAKLDYTFDWSARLALGDTIVNRSWTIAPATDVTLAGQTTATVFVSTLTRGKTYVLTEHVVTAAGVIDEQSVTIVCETT